ncbi:hypothetical protein CNR22_03495 [Sphingobacteriaceae bacterium]|nr:hypothetical protein CNR22_03495 [Sphingobacteriaceae bacterium]
MKKIYTLVLAFAALFSTAQTICSSSGNVMLFTNYDGGTITINVDQNISNLKIGICSYEACQVNLSGAFIANVTAVHYAGFNNSNNSSCGASIATTTITGAPGTAAVSVSFAPAATLSNANGYGSIICGYSCNNTTSQGGCNTVDQVEAYFLNYFSGSSLYAHKVQYGCWTGTQSLSVGGNCCPPPPVYGGSITASQTICAGQTPNSFSSSASASVTSGTITYEWQSSTTSVNSGFTTIASANSLTYAPGALSQTTYFRRAASTSTSNVGYSDVITVYVLPLPLVSISGNTAVCFGSSTILNATGGTSYFWSPGGFTSSVAVFSPTISTIVSVTCFPSNGCSVAVNVPLLVNPLPFAVVSSSHPNSLCLGSTATLTASGGVSYTWIPGNLSGANVTVSPQTTTAYTVSVQNQNGCVSKTLLILNVDPVPVISILSSPALVCSGQSNTLTGVGATTFTWLPMNIISTSVSVLPTGTSVYTVIGEDGNCSDSASVTLQPLPSPTVLVGSVKQNICRNESTFITVAGAATYTLQNSNTAIMSNSISVSPTITTNYTVAGTGANGCSGLAVKTITVFGCIGLADENLTQSNGVIIYPNPNNGEFYLRAEKGMSLKLMNSVGQVVRQLELNSGNSFKISVTGLTTGIYFIVNADKSFHQKLIVQTH